MKLFFVSDWTRCSLFTNSDFRQRQGVVPHLCWESVSIKTTYPLWPCNEYFGKLWNYSPHTTPWRRIRYKLIPSTVSQSLINYLPLPPTTSHHLPHWFITSLLCESKYTTCEPHPQKNDSVFLMSYSIGPIIVSKNTYAPYMFSHYVEWDVRVIVVWFVSLNSIQSLIPHPYHAPPDLYSFLCSFYTDSCYISIQISCHFHLFTRPKKASPSKYQLYPKRFDETTYTLSLTPSIALCSTQILFAFETTFSYNKQRGCSSSIDSNDPRQAWASRREMHFHSKILQLFGLPLLLRFYLFRCGCLVLVEEVLGNNRNLGT